MINQKSIYSLSLGESIIVGEDFPFGSSVLRVPGGWVVSTYDKSRNMMGSCFVPYNTEFISGLKVTVNNNVVRGSGGSNSDINKEY